MPRRVLVVFKKSAYEDHFEEYRPTRLKRAFLRGDANLARLKKSHSVHYATVREVLSSLEERRLPFEARERGASEAVTDHYDLVVTVGGDGTLLEVARGVTRQPVLAVNSDPSHSVGMLCRADRKSFAKTLDRLLEGKAKIVPLRRLEMRLNGKRLAHEPVLNDVLVAHANPAAVSHYEIALGAVRERQRSSGVWIATAAGSTGGVLSAGGRRLPCGSERFQYLPRELYFSRRYRYRLKGGLVPPGARIRLRSLMREGTLFVDGAHRRHPFPYGSTLEIGPSSRPLRLVS